MNTKKCKDIGGPLLVEQLRSLVGSELDQQRDSRLVESEGGAHVVSGVYDLQLQLSDPRLSDRNSRVNAIHQNMSYRTLRLH